MATRRINAHKLVADIGSGLTYGHLMERYSLSKASLDSLLQKLVNSGLVASEDLPPNDHVPDDFDSRLEDVELLEEPTLAGAHHHAQAQFEETGQGGLGDRRTEGSWECIVCGAARPNRSGVCPTCGLKSGTVPSHVFKGIEAVSYPTLVAQGAAEKLRSSFPSGSTARPKGPMNSVDRIIDAQFKTAEDGRKLFFPWKAYLSRKSYGYVVLSENKYARLHRDERRWLTEWTSAACIASFLIGACAEVATGSQGIGHIMFLLPLVSSGVAHILWLRSQCRHLEKTDDKYLTTLRVSEEVLHFG